MSQLARDKDSMNGRGACELSVVTTLYRSAPFLQDFVARCERALDAIGVTDYELVFVDDGSPDDSVDVLRELRGRHAHIRIVELARNFGHHHAAVAGLAHARGSLVFLTDCDLEVDPSVLVDFRASLHAQNADVVYGYQQTRKGQTVERVGGSLFWRLLNVLSDTPVPADMVTERLMTRRYIDALLTLGDRNLFLAGMMSWTGFTQIGLPVTKVQRRGAATYTLRKRIALLTKAITSFSAKPLYASLWIGATALAFSIAHAGYIVVRKILHPASTLAGFPTLVALLAAMFGIIMLSIGIIGVYVARIFVQAQNRPIYIVKNIE